MSAPLIGTVIGAEGGVYTLALEDGRQIEAKLRGRIKQHGPGADKIVIGDRVEVTESDGAATIDTLLPRSTTMVRRGGSGGRRPKVLAANLDRVFVVMAAAPTPHAQLVDRLLVVAEANRIRPILILNKMDLPGAEEASASLASRYRAIGYEVLGVSARGDVGIDALRALLCEGISAFMGPSGAGKSTLLNRIQPGLKLRTGELSQKTGTGRHTTVSSRLLTLSCGGAVADTPGFSDVGLWEMDPGELDDCFPEMRGLKDECRFRDCVHLKEPGCAVLEAVEDGRMTAERYQSYVVLRAEAVAARER